MPKIKILKVRSCLNSSDLLNDPIANDRNGHTSTDRQKNGHQPLTADCHTSISLKDEQSHSGSEKKVRKNFFPQKLMDMLSSPFFSDCTAWTSDGKAFFIMDSDKFLEKYASFYQGEISIRKKSLTRKLNRWGFKMELVRGPKCGSYSHPLFRKDEPWLLLQITVCKKRALSDTESSNSSDDEERPLKKVRPMLPKTTERSSTDVIMKKTRSKDRKQNDHPELMNHIENNLFSSLEKRHLMFRELSMHQRLRMYRMNQLFQFENEVAKAFCGDVLGPNGLYSDVHNRIVENALKVLLP